MRNMTSRMNWPLAGQNIERIHGAALDILESIGMGEPLPEIVKLALSAGGHLNERQRLCFPRTLVEEAIEKAGRPDTLFGRDPRHTVSLDAGRVLYGHCGIAPMVADLETGMYRASTALDLYDLNRLANCLDNIPLGAIYVIPTDIPDPLECDLNKVYAMAAGTTKPLTFDVSDAAHVAPVRALVDMLSGDDCSLERQPSFVIGACPTVSPLRFEERQSRVMIEAVKYGFPVSAIIAPMAGATAPAPLAGALAQTVAEALAALVQIHLVKPGHPLFLGIWPFVADLRTGSFSGGGGEQALLSAAASQMVSWYGLRGSACAGLTDAKLPDAQCGYEKGIAATLAALGGATIVGDFVAMQGSLMGAAFDAMVIDDDMIGNINRVLRGLEVNDETLSCAPIAEAVHGTGNFLTLKQTRKYMRSEYCYPRLADRSAIDQWQKDGSMDVRSRARAKARELLRTAPPIPLPGDLDERIRKQFPIRIPRAAMLPDSGRW